MKTTERNAGGIRHVLEHAGYAAARARLAELVTQRDAKVAGLLELRERNAGLRDKIDKAAQAIVAGEPLDASLLDLVRSEEERELAVAIAQQAVNLQVKRVREEFERAVAERCAAVAPELAALERRVYAALIELAKLTVQKEEVFAQLSAAGVSVNDAESVGGLRVGTTPLGSPRTVGSRFYYLFGQGVKLGYLDAAAITPDLLPTWPRAEGLVVVRFLRHWQRTGPHGHPITQYHAGESAGFSSQVAAWLVNEGIANRPGAAPRAQGSAGPGPGREAKRVVEFLRADMVQGFGGYNPGETAGFPESICEHLVAAGVARWASPAPVSEE